MKYSIMVLLKHNTFLKVLSMSSFLTFLNSFFDSEPIFITVIQCQHKKEGVLQLVLRRGK